MTVLVRLCAIINITIFMLTRWLASNFNILADYNLSVRFMGRMVDELETALEAIEEEGDLILDEEFMILVFQVIMDDLPTFEKYWTHMLQNKSMPVVGECQSKVFTLSRLLNNIFSPEDDTNKGTYAMIGKMFVTSAKALLADI